MAGLSDVVTVTVTRDTAFPTQQGFGVPLVLAYHTTFAGRIQYYGSIKEVTDAGFAVTSEVYRLASRAFASNPRLPKLAVGRKAAPTTKTIRLFPQTATTGTVYNFTVVDKLQVEFPITRTVPGASTIAAECTAIAALVTALTNVNATATATYVEVTGAAAADFFRIKALPGPNAVANGAIKVTDVSADPGLAADLTAIESVDATGWFMIASESNSEAETAAIAAWAQTREKMYGATTSDSDVVDNAITTDIASDLKTSAYDHTFLVYYGLETDSGAALGWQGKKLPVDLDTDSTTWELATIPGLAADATLTTTHEGVLKNKNAAYYATIGGFPLMLNSKVAQGEWIDVMHESFWFTARLQEDCFQPLYVASNSGRKIPFTDAGALVILGVAKARTAQAVKKGFLKADPAPTFTMPKVEDTTLGDRAARHFRPIRIDAKIAGAIHKTTLSVNLAL